MKRLFPLSSALAAVPFVAAARQPRLHPRRSVAAGRHVPARSVRLPPFPAANPVRRTTARGPATVLSDGGRPHLRVRRPDADEFLPALQRLRLALRHHDARSAAKPALHPAAARRLRAADALDRTPLQHAARPRPLRRIHLRPPPRPPRNGADLLPRIQRFGSVDPHLDWRIPTHQDQDFAVGAAARRPLPAHRLLLYRQRRPRRKAHGRRGGRRRRTLEGSAQIPRQRPRGDPQSALSARVRHISNDKPS